MIISFDKGVSDVPCTLDVLTSNVQGILVKQVDLKSLELGVELNYLTNRSGVEEEYVFKNFLVTSFKLICPVCIGLGVRGRVNINHYFLCPSISVRTVLQATGTITSFVRDF